MAEAIEIRFPPGRSNDYYFRVFWFAEDIWGPIVNGGLGKLSDIDHPPSDVVYVYLSRNRHLAEAKSIIKKALQKAKLQDDAVISVSEG
ncbi:MAG TPA: hypothetical protein PLP01_01115 [Phycisphaerae bacterium]|nr:hypothetical protein [Phycisphaerae bacterium]HOI53825.1 hypothetical protein [Phycisphaerae bacterium]